MCSHGSEPISEIGMDINSLQKKPAQMVQNLQVFERVFELLGLALGSHMSRKGQLIVFKDKSL